MVEPSVCISSQQEAVPESSARSGFNADEFLASLRVAQQIAKKYIVPGRSMVDELIAERREEAARERRDG